MSDAELLRILGLLLSIPAVRQQIEELIRLYWSDQAGGCDLGDDSAPFPEERF